jgi:hypothetical protein
MIEFVREQGVAIRVLTESIRAGRVKERVHQNTAAGHAIYLDFSRDESKFFLTIQRSIGFVEPFEILPGNFLPMKIRNGLSVVQIINIVSNNHQQKHNGNDE